MKKLLDVKRTPYENIAVTAGYCAGGGGAGCSSGCGGGGK